jgi:serine protease Do
LAEYRSILGEVHVVCHYENEDGVERRSPYSFGGSGFLLDSTTVLTAYHVVDEIHLPDTLRSSIRMEIEESCVTAELLAWDSILDVALLRLSNPVERPVYGLDRLSQGASLEYGDEILGLGHHSGLTTTLTSGIVSAPSRRAPELGNWIQIDAPVTRGASGGMLVGPDGYIHGVLVAGLVGEDLNFAIPSSDIVAVIDRLLSGRSVRHSWLGLLLRGEQPASDDGPGVIIRDIFPSSPVAQFDIPALSSIVEINHTPIRTVQEAQVLLGSTSPGNLVHLSLVANGDERELWVQTRSRPDYAMYNGHGEFDRIQTLYPFFGLEVDAEHPQRESFLDNQVPVTLLLYPVTRVDEMSFLASRGVAVGDHIGFIYDRFYGMTRVLRVFHLPAGKSVEELHSVSDYIFILERDRYDQNIL